MSEERRHHHPTDCYIGVDPSMRVCICPKGWPKNETAKKLYEIDQLKRGELPARRPDRISSYDNRGSISHSTEILSSLGHYKTPQRNGTPPRFDSFPPEFKKTRVKVGSLCPTTLDKHDLSWCYYCNARSSEDIKP